MSSHGVFSRRPDDNRRSSYDTYDRPRPRIADRDRDRDRDWNRDRDRDRDRDGDRARERGGHDVSPYRPREAGQGGHDRDGPRGPPRQPATMGLSKPDTVADRAGKWPSTPVSPRTQRGGNPEHMPPLLATATQIARLSAVISQQAALDKALDQRKAEANRTKAKHAEFPSIPELQNRYRLRDERLRQELHEEEQKARAELAEALEKLPSKLPGSSQLAESQAHAREAQYQALQKEIDSKLNTLKATLQTHPDGSMQKANDLKSQLDKLKGALDEHEKRAELVVADLKKQTDLDLDVLIQDVTKHTDVIQGEMDSLRERVVESEKLQSRQTVRMLEQQQEISDLGKKLQSQQDESDARSEQQQKQHQELADEFRKHQEAFAQYLKQQANMTKSSATNANTTSAQELAKAQTENINLRSANEALQKEVSEVRQRAEELESRLALQEGQIKALSDSVDSFARLVEEQSKKVMQIEGRLMDVDFEMLDSISESYGLAFPKVQQNVKKAQEDIQALHTYIDTGLLKLVAGWVENLRENDKARAKEIEQLRGQVGVRNIPNATKEPVSTSSSPPVDDGHIKSEVASYKTEMQSLRLEYDGRLTQQHESITKVQQELTDKYECLKHMITDLDGKYNNITTQRLAEHIIGHMETIYPNAKHIETKLREVNRVAVETEKLAEVNKRKLSDLERSSATMLQRLIEVESRGEQLARPNKGSDTPNSRHCDDPALQQPPRKRIRGSGSHTNGNGGRVTQDVVYVKSPNGTS